MGTIERINYSIYKGAGFIYSQQDRDGLWRDFETLAGRSSDWVSGFVLRALSLINCPDDVILPAVKNLVLRQMPNGGWSYNKNVPTDCDSTAWVLMALLATSTWRPSVIQKGMDYILRHQTSQGGFSTYNPMDGIHKYIQAPSINDMSGWFEAHGCVTGVAVQSLLENCKNVNIEKIQKAASFLFAQKDISEVWRSYWWKGYAYSTYNSLKALLMCRALRDDELKSTLRVILSTQKKDGGWNDNSGTYSEVFGTAFAVLSLLLDPNKYTFSASEKGVHWLIDNQNPDGSWPSVPIMRIPPPMIKIPDTIGEWRINDLGTGVIIEDDKMLFTSSAALWAISIYKSML